MGQTKSLQLEHVQLENVSFHSEGLDPVLKSVDLDIPMDKTVVVQATNPMHAVHFLEILAGLRLPQSGKVKWIDSENHDEFLKEVSFFKVVSSYFESHRPDGNKSVRKIFSETGATKEMILSAIEHFEIHALISTKFKELSYSLQKLVLLTACTLCAPQMLVLEDPAVGLTENQFLNYLDWIQMWQRQGHIRHVFLTNNHKTAARHFEHISLMIDEGLVYVEDENVFKKVVHF